MDHHIIQQIVEKMFDKAKKSCSSHAPNALSKHIADESDYEFNYRTAERAYKRYIDNNTGIGAPIPETINSFCKYLDCDNYKDYVEKNIKNDPKTEEPKDKKELDNIEGNTTDLESEGGENNKKNRRWILTLKITTAFALTFIIYQLVNPTIGKKNTIQPIECMTWSVNHYEKIDCDFQLHPEYGTKVEPYDAYKSKMKKLKVNASYDFFSKETGRPLVWYYKTKKGTLEYFNLPGFHPLNGETLKKITQGMIEKYIPIHITKPDSFVSSDNISSTNADIAILVLDGNDFDNQLTSALKTNYFNKKSSIVRLKGSDIYDENFISNFSTNEKLFLNTKSIKVDTLFLGVSKYDFHNNIDKKDMIICNLQFDFQIHIHNNNNNNWKEVITKTTTSIGTGYSITEAKTNAIKKINYE
ncbi:hypothetical protein [uncultured Algibacter sp.]|uniref:hypothetical protein n=1 Tax=uncultured Algibacter sp. TaxID=298659 RepID=UPI003216653B